MNMCSKCRSTPVLSTRRDLEGQETSDRHSMRHSRLWTILIDIPLIIIVVALIGLFEIGVIPSHRAGFFCNDQSLAFPYRGDTVSTSVLVSTIFLAPLIVILVTELIFQEQEYNYREKTIASMKNTLWVYRNYIYGMIFNFAVIEIMKGITGSPRPTFFYICEPDTGKTCNGSEFVSTFECTSTRFSKWMQNDSYHSFPSGHTSLSVHCGLFIAWYLQKRAFDWRFRTVFVVPLVQLICISFAAISSLTRITDRRHHWWDVVIGFVIGLFTFLYAAIVLSRGSAINRTEKPISSSIHQSVKSLIYNPRTIDSVSP
ncbi:unnamed protein product [Diatraea saccharalis]|uniref:Phosphatidic acid phosphatase type 2/haloperoxidase domain-containing protein n=1 Tax=Diatraea saccharalis TaxID=40085 RepID=A0A9N9WLR0_9NEOP|nr:unnamed protein product [Diatraea saccharalis]